MTPETLHPSLLELELCRTGEAGDDVAEHVRGCAACQASVRQLGELTEKLFLATPPPHGFDPAKEAVMLEFIRRRAREIRQRSWIRSRWLKVAAGIAIAGALAILVHLQRQPAATPMAGEDFNLDGQVDILDALALARQTQSDRSPEVCRLAIRIVALDEGGPR